jgi:ribosome-binding factor A
MKRTRGARSGESRGGMTPSMLPGGRSQRQLRVGEELRHVLTEVLREAHFRDPNLADVSVTVTEVRVSPDLKNATAFVMPLAGRDDAKILAGLTRAQAYIRGEVAHRMSHLRFTPTLSFKRDQSFDEAARIGAALANPVVQADLKKTPEDE